MRLCLAVTALVVVLAGGAAGRGDGYPGCAPGKDLRFRSADGTRLVGHRFGTGTTAVVLGHQSRGSLCQWVPYAKRLASLGYTVVAFDFRGNGYSRPGPKRPITARYPADMSAAAKVARNLGARKVFLIGASAGGTAAVISAASTRPPVDGVISLSGPAVFGGDAVAAAKHVAIPALYIAAANDGDYAADAKQLYAATTATDKTVEIVPGFRHGVDLVAIPGRARTLVESFLRSHAS